MSEPWLRLPEESNKGYHAFCVYRDMSPNIRSYDKVREALGRTTGYTRQIEHWASLYKWVLRAGQYDDHNDKAQLEAVETARKEMAERQAKVGVLLQSKGIEKMQAVQPGDISAREAITSIVEGTRIERIARGEPSEIQKSEHSGSVNLTARELSDEELMKIIQQGGSGG